MNNFNPYRNDGLPPYQGNPYPGGPPPSGGLRPPIGPPPFFGHLSHFKPPLPMTFEGFKEMRYMMILMILVDTPEGITGYQLQKQYNFPRGNLLRTLDDLVDMDYVKTSESVIDGRAQKFFIITDKGKQFLDELKKKWINRLAMMPDIGPPGPEGLKAMLLDKINDFESKDDAVDFFRGLRSWMKGVLQHIEKRIDQFKRAKADLDQIIDVIEKMNSLKKEKIKQLVKESIKKVEERERNV